MPRAILDLISSSSLSVSPSFSLLCSYELDKEKTRIAVNTGKPRDSGTKFNVGHDGVGVKNDLKYVYVGSETQVHDDPNIALFFLEKDLNPGSKFDLQFTKMTFGSLFITHSQANTIPLSSNKLLEILTHFQRMVMECEVQAMKGESKFCAMSLESMMEFNMMSLEIRDNGDAEMKRSYNVALTGVCAMGEEKLKPKHLSFQMRKVNLGSVSVCYFIEEDVLWIVRK
ncbi:BURP domain-containing protein [Dioscorea alata]|uniref:BURP domain-containing protein n=1 Tax=Dioscorea alata TaxID=55571 RepID=A0ACB7VSW9_DIOAL|nr:BURP domain-containing protein [Dioscorea alata]